MLYSIQDDNISYEMTEYILELRESVLKAYTGIIQGLKGVEQIPRTDFLHKGPHLMHIFDIIKSIVRENNNLTIC